MGNTVESNFTVTCNQCGASSIFSDGGKLTVGSLKLWGYLDRDDCRVQTIACVCKSEIEVGGGIVGIVPLVPKPEEEGELT